ncbi:MAG: LPS O-antigen length regulator [Actinobacteria bacterium]|nr:LPS O-antigen length regulator [Actinomycetota bacterium]
MGNQQDTLQTDTFDDEIDLRELFSVLWSGKKIILAVTALAAFISVVYALSLPNIYQSEALLAPKMEGGASGLSAMAAQYSGLASLAGINLPGGGGDNKSLIAQEKMKSLDFFTKQIYEQVLPALMALDSWDNSTGAVIFDDDIYDAKTKTWVREADPPRKSKPSAQEAFEQFAGIFSVSEDKTSGFVSLSMKHESPVIAEAWLSLIIYRINEDIRERDIREAKQSVLFLEGQREQTSLVSLDEVFASLIEEQTKIIMLANASKDYVFEVIEPPVVPEQKSEPKRALICVLGTMLGGMLAVLLVLVRHYAVGSLSEKES